MNTRNISISLVATPEISAAVLYGFHEVFASVGRVWEMITGTPANCRQMVPRIVAAAAGPVPTAIGATIIAEHSYDEAHRSDIVIVGDLNLALGDDLTGKWTRDAAWLRDQYARGAIICSVCTGSLMLAEAGLLDGCEATSHWSAAPVFKQYYPQVSLKPDRILVPAGDEHRIVTSGGSASWNDLAIYLIARFCGDAEARHIAKIFLFGDRSEGQLPFAAMVRPAQHDDAVISKCQEWIADNYALPNPVARTADISGLSPRTFKRRFKAATGYAPLDYIQTLRIEEAKQMLETTGDAIDDIAESVGYEDAGAFRRLFKRTTGLSPHQYRVRFKNICAL